MVNTLKLGGLVALLGTCTLLAFAFRSSSAPTPEGDEHTEAHLYATWDRFEVDRCVAAWLIKRFVDSEAEFEFYPVGSPIPSDGRIAFDTPGTRYTRVAGKSVSALVVEEFGLRDPAVDKLVQLVQTTEVAFWMLKSGSEEAKLREVLQSLWTQTTEPEARLMAIFAHLDSLRSAH